LNVPFAIADATSLTEAGYVGEDVENILLKLIQAADYDIERAEKGIIYIDEIDKIARKIRESFHNKRRKRRRCTAGSFKKFLKERLLQCLPREVESIPIRSLYKLTQPIFFFICGGAFDGIEKIIQNRIGKKSMGFGAKNRESEESQCGRNIKEHPSTGLAEVRTYPRICGKTACYSHFAFP